MSSEKVTEVKKEQIEADVHNQSIENQGILEEVAHIGGRIAGAARNTAIGVKDAVLQAGGFAKDKAIAAKEYVVGKETETTHHDGQREWFSDTGVDKAELMEERKHVLGESATSFDKTSGGGVGGFHTVDQGVHTQLDQGFSTDKKDVQDVMKGVYETDKMYQKDKLGGIESGDQRDALGGFHDKYVMPGEKKEGLLEGEKRDWFQDTGVSKKEVMEERKTVLGDNPEALKAKFEAVEKREGQIGGPTGTEFADTGARPVLGERTGTIPERFDNTSNTVANKAGQLKDTVSEKAVLLKDTAIEKGTQLKDAAIEKGTQLKDATLEKGTQVKDAALEKGTQLKDAAVEKGTQLKDAALEKGGQMKVAATETAYQWKDAATDKAYQLKDSALETGQQLKDSALETGQQLKDTAALKGQQAKASALEAGDQLKGKAIDAGIAVQEKGISLKAATEKGYADQAAQADKENVRY